MGRALPGSRGTPLGVASGSGSGAPCSLDSDGTSATAAERLGNPEWWDDLEHVYSTRTADERDRWRARELRYRRIGRATSTSRGSAGALAKAVYAGAKARALDLRRKDVVNACSGRVRVIACKCGPMAVAVGCDQPLLCERCQKRHWFRWRKRLTRGLRTHLAAERATWRGKYARKGMMPGVYLLTLTVPHSGDVGVDRDALADGWRKLYKVANREGWFRTYAAVYEIAGAGHVHMHVAILSSWLPYVRLHEVWRASVPGALVLDVQAPTARSKPGAAANYLSKYVTKGAQVIGLSGATAGAWLAASRGRRKVTTSARFWRDPGCCLTCRERYRLRERPPGLAEHAPMAVYMSRARKYGITPGYGAVKLLPLGGVTLDHVV